MKKEACCLLLSLWLSLGFPAICLAERIYQIPETQLMQLENNLTKVSLINQESQKKYQTALDKIKRLEELLKKQKELIAQQAQKSLELEKKLKQSETDSLKQINSLAKANEYLDKYVNQEEKKKSKLKTERNILLGALATAIIVAVSK